MSLETRGKGVAWFWDVAENPNTLSLSKKEEQGYDAVLEYLREKKAIGLLSSLSFEVVNGVGYSRLFSTVGAYFEVIWPEVRATAIGYGLDPEHTVREFCDENGEWLDAAPQLMDSSSGIQISVWLRPYFSWKRKVC